MNYEEIPEGHWVIHNAKTHAPLFHDKDLKVIMKEVEKHNIADIYVMRKYTDSYFAGEGVAM